MEDEAAKMLSSIQDEKSDLIKKLKTQDKEWKLSSSNDTTINQLPSST